MKKPVSIVVSLAVLAISVAVTGCKSEENKPATPAERKHFMGGPMPANVGALISQRMRDSQARAGHPPPASH